MADDNSIGMFDEVKAVRVQTVNGKRYVSDEQMREEALQRPSN